MPHLAHTSVPLWAVEPPRPGAGLSSADGTGTSYLLVGVGPEAAHVLEAWAAGLAAGAYADAVRVLHADDVPAAREALARALGRAWVGVRLRLTGPAAACLALRATAVAAGVEDDELHVQPTDATALELFCAHCRHVTPVAAAVGDVVPCDGCDRSLVVYHHVSRRTGWFLGYMSDAEEAGA